MKVRKMLCFVLSLLIAASSLYACKTNENAEVNRPDSTLKNFDGYVTVNGVKYPNDNSGGMQAELIKKYTSLKEVYDDAEYIVEAEVIKSETPEHSDTSPLVLTPNKVKILDVFKGDLKKEDIITIVETGKHLDNGKDEAIDGAPLLNDGMKTILFLKKSVSGRYLTIGCNYGKFFFDSNDLIHNSLELSLYNDSYGKFNSFNTKAMNDNAAYKTDAKTKSGLSINTKPGVTLEDFKKELDTYK